MVKSEIAIRRAIWTVSFLLLLNVPAVQAATPACGTTLTKNTKLDSNMNCPDTALRLIGKASKNVTLNCNGFIIQAGATAIVAFDTSGVTIKNCNLQTFDTLAHGIRIAGGTSKATVSNNRITTSGAAGRGIWLRQSSNNKIINNVITTASTRNAHALELLSGSNKNLIRGNELLSSNSYPLSIQSSNNNRIENNTLNGAIGYLNARSLSLQNGGLGIDASGNIYALENDVGANNGDGKATALFIADPVTGKAGSVIPVTLGGEDIGFGFDALEVLPNGTLLAVPGCCQSTTELYQIDPITGNATPIPLNIVSGSGKLNGLEATGNNSLLATSDAGELLNIDLNTNNVTLIGDQSISWADVAVHPTSGKAYAVSSPGVFGLNSVRLFEINPGTGQVISEIGMTSEPFIWDIDFAPDGTLYGGGDEELIAIDTTFASVTEFGSGGYGPDPLEPMPRKNRFKGNRFRTLDGSIHFPGNITLPTAIETDIDAARLDIAANEAMVDSAELPFLDEKARITLNNLSGTYRNLLVDPEDDGSFEPCLSPQCKHVSFQGGDLVFEVNGFTTYSSEENTDPTLEFVASVVLDEVKALQSGGAVSKSSIKKLAAARKDLGKAVKFLKRRDFKKGLNEISKATADLSKAKKKVTVVEDLIDKLVDGAHGEAQLVIDQAIAVNADPLEVAEAQANATSAQDNLIKGKADKAVSFYRKAWDVARKAAFAADWQWTTRSNGGVLRSVAWSGSGFVATGDRCTISTSSDGFNWSIQKPLPDCAPFASDVSDVIWTGTQFAAVADKAVYTSPDGSNWTRRPTNASVSLRAISWSGSKFVAVGPSSVVVGGVILNSVDGVTWTAQTTPNQLYDITWSGTQFVAVGQNQTILTSPDGVAWTSRNSGVGSISSIVWSGAQFIAGGHNGSSLSSQGLIYTSTDGVIWTPLATGTATRFNDIAWSGTQFVAVGADPYSDTGDRVLTSPNGITWTSRLTDVENSARLLAVTWSGSQFVAAGVDGNILTSPDGVSWTLQQSGNSLPLRALAQSDNQIVAVGGLSSAPGEIATSLDGIDWTPGSANIEYPLHDVVWAGTQFVAVGGLQGVKGLVVTSLDGTNWTPRSSGTINLLRGIAWSGTQFVAVGAGSPTGTVLTSPDGINWAVQVSGIPESLNDVIWTGILFMAVGEGGSIASSPDGITWTLQLSPVSETLNSIVWSGFEYVAVGSMGTVVTSVDGISWHQQNSGTTSTLNSISWSGLFYLVAANIGQAQVGQTFSSPDAVVWTQRTLTPNETNYGVIWSGDRFVVTGTAGTIQTAP